MKKTLIILTLFLYSCSGLYNDSFTSPESSWIVGASYNSQTKALTIETSKQAYDFKDVPTDVWEGFKKASSKGKYYNQYIRGRYTL